MRRSCRPSLVVTLLAGLACTPAFAEDGQAGGQAAMPRPNVLIFMLDDVGFAQLSSYGGLVQTPNIDRVAKAGLRFANYHTAPICSASRAALLTGRNPHSVRVAGHAAAALPLRAHEGVIQPEDGTLAANLKAAGYVTFALGKWDHLPSSEMTPAGPFTRWPTGQGFDRYYGFLGADADNWSPPLTQDTTAVAKPEGAGYHLDRDLADKAISMIQSRSASATPAPFMMYFATGTAHAPHHAPRSWIESYRGKFDLGWDVARQTILERQIAQGLIPATAKLAPRPAGMPAWETLTPDQKRLYSRQMEVFAAALGHADAQFGRILDALAASGELDNTLVIVTSDNGASAEGADHGTHNEPLFFNGHYPDVAENLPFLDRWGGPETYPHYALGWAVAGNTPLRYYKQTTHEGGTRVPLVVAWPRGIAARGEVRQQFVHVSDVAPTVMDLARVPAAPTLANVPQTPMEGLSFSYALADKAALDAKKMQYSELYGNKGLWADGWTIVTSHRLQSWIMSQTNPITEPWELYDLRRDPGQTRDLAAQYPERVRAMAAMFDEQAAKYDVTPLANMGEVGPYAMQSGQEAFKQRGGRWVYWGPVNKVAEGAGPPTRSGPFRLTVELDLPEGRETGPIYAQGGAHGGMSLYLKDGVPHFVVRDLNGRRFALAGSAPLAKGPNRLELQFNRKRTRPLADAETSAILSNNGQEIARASGSVAMPFGFSVSETFDLGIDWGSAPTADYKPGRPFEGRIGKVEFDFN